MKKIIIIAAVILCTALSNAQQCAPGVTSFNTQAEVDIFVATYQNSGCNSVEGLNIAGFGNTVTDLSGLSFLTSIGSSGLFINNADLLTDLTGLENITSIGGSTNISSNEILVSIDGLSSLTMAGFGNVSSNPLLESCCIIVNENLNLIVFNNAPSCSSQAAIQNYCELKVDADLDGVLNEDDNCPNTPNASQTDTNNNGIGDACENDTSINTGNDGGGVGINTTNPTSAFEVTDGDVFINNQYRGIIMKSAEGKCFRYKPANDGSLNPKEITCPDN